MRVSILFQLTHLNFWHLNIFKTIDPNFESIQEFLFSGPKSLIFSYILYCIMIPGTKMEQRKQF